MSAEGKRPNVYGISRDLWDHPVFAKESFTQAQAWAWLIGAAAWRTGMTRGNAGPVDLVRGEFSFSVRFLAERWDWSKSAVDRFFEKLSKHEMIRDTSREGAKVYSINKYNDYQLVGVPKREVSGTAAGQQRDSSGTKKETGKQENNSSDTPPKAGAAKSKSGLPEDFPHDAAKKAASDYWLAKGRQDLTASVDEQAAQFRDHHTKEGTRNFDWPATWRTWVRNALSFTRAPRTNGHQAAPALPAPADAALWLWRLEAFWLGIPDEEIAKGHWSAKWGPKPGEGGCLAPQDAMQAFWARHPRQAGGGGAA